MFSLTLVDNASIKDDANYFYKKIEATQFGGQVAKIIRNQQNTGFPTACNQGAKGKHAPYIFFLNSDVILQTDAIEQLVDAMDFRPMAGVVGMKLVFPDDVQQRGLNTQIRPANKVQHVGLSVDINGRIHHPFIGWDENHPRVNRMNGLYQFAVTGAALMVRRDLFNKIGGFSQEYGIGTYEDVDLCMKVRELGYNIYVNTEAVGRHYTGASAEIGKSQFPLNQNEALFKSKWMKKLEWWDAKVL